MHYESQIIIMYLVQREEFPIAEGSLNLLFVLMRIFNYSKIFMVVFFLIEICSNLSEVSHILSLYLYPP